MYTDVTFVTLIWWELNPTLQIYEKYFIWPAFFKLTFLSSKRNFWKSTVERAEQTMKFTTVRELENGRVYINAFYN